MSDKILYREDLLKILPHREPFIFVDKVVVPSPFATPQSVLNKGEYATGYYFIKPNADWTRGHFPNFPVFPGVYILEAMAQTAIALTGYRLDINFSKEKVFLMSIDDARFRQPVRPDDTLRLKLEVVNRKALMCKYKAYAFVEDKEVAEAGIMAAYVK